MYQDKFSSICFDVVCASEAEGGIELIKKEKPDLIILDVLLPRENGIVFLERIKEDKDICLIPVIILSNFDTPESKEKAVKLGAKAYLIKANYTPQQDVDEINKCL